MNGNGIGGYIRGARERRGITQSELADLAGIPRPHLSDIERGRIALPNADLRRRLAAALGVSHVDLLVAAGELTQEEAGKRLEPVRSEFDQVLQGLSDSEQEAVVDIVRRLRRAMRLHETAVSRSALVEPASA